MVPPLLDGVMPGSFDLPVQPTQRGRAPALDVTSAWTLLRGLRGRHGTRVSAEAGPVWVAIADDGSVAPVDPGRAAIVLSSGEPRGWGMPSPSAVPFDASTTQLLDLFVPLCVGPGRDAFVVGHLAQSLDGRVATAGGVSQFISGTEDVEHTHRLRAVFDAVIVGARTVEHDDPRLTTRLCPGDDPTRVVLDPSGRLTPSHRVFSDGLARTILVVGASTRAFESCKNTEVVEVRASEGWMPVAAVVEALAQRGLRRLFVEGGGITMSGFIKAGLLDRIHVTVAPMLLGSGRPSFVFPEAATLEDAMRLDCRHFSLGRDVLFDCPLPR